MTMWAYASGAALIVGSLAGWSVRDAYADADRTEAAEAMLTATVKAAKDMNAQAAGYEAVRAAQEPSQLVERNTIREIHRALPPPAAECATPAAVVSVLDAARQRANAAAIGQSGTALPGPAGDP